MTGRPVDAAWESRVAGLWTRADALDADALLAEVQALRALRPPGDAAATMELACAYDALGREAEAVPLYEQAVAAGLDPERHARALAQLGSSLRNVGRAAEAVQVLAAAHDHPSVGAARDAFLVLALHDAGRPADALRTALAALAPTLPSYQRAGRGLRRPAPAGRPRPGRLRWLARTRPRRGERCTSPRIVSPWPRRACGPRAGTPS